MEQYNSIQQLLKKEGGKKNPVFPPTVIQAVFDAKTGASLEAILAQFNSVHLQYQGSPKATRLIIPKEMRRAGLTITYMNMEGETITERASSAVQKDSDNWGLDINWSRVDELSLFGDISVSAQGTWIINGHDTGVKAVGPKGDAGLTPWLKTIDNRLHLSYDNVTWEPCSDPIAAYFRWNNNKIQISRDNKTWTDLSGTFADNLHIKGYVATTSALPSGAAQGDIYGVGPTYAAEDTAHTNPIYRYYVRNANTWVDNGPFTSIAAGIVQESGDSENVVMSQKAVTEKFSELGQQVSGKATKVELQAEVTRATNAESALSNSIEAETTRATAAELELRKSINNETIRAKEAEEDLENSVNANRYGYNANRYGYNVTVNGLKGGIHTIESAIKDVPSKFRMLGQKITFRTENGDWATYHNESLSLDNYENVNDWVQEVGISEVRGDVNITNAPDYEDLTEAKDGTIMFADKEYNKESYSGLGRVYLRKNIVDGVNVLTQDMISKPNTIYIIQYDYDLQDAEITIPEGCVLDFQGGSFSNGTIVGNKTSIKAEIIEILKVIILLGDWNVAEGYPEWFGAVGDGVTDDYIPLQKSIDYFKSIYISKVYNTNKPLVFQNNYKRLHGGGTLRKISEDTLFGINAIIVIAYRSCIENIFFSGTPNSVTAIALYSQSANSIFSNLKISSCFAGIKDYASCFMISMTRIHCVNCENGIDFSYNIDKTSLTLINCWCENCGQAYDFKRTIYSTLINCGADWCNYQLDTNPYGKGYGDTTTEKGIYNFETCSNVGLINCGAESSYGNGAVRVYGTDIIINGLTVYNTRSEFHPPFGNYPNWAVGVITTGDSKSTMSIDNLRIGDFENTFVTQNYPTKKQCIVALNYSIQAYGDPKKIMVYLGNYLNNSSNPLEEFGGHAIHTNPYLCFSRNTGLYPSQENKLDGYKSKTITSESLVNTLRIPVISNSNSNSVGMIEIYGINNESNHSVPDAFHITIAFNSLTSVSNLTIIEKSSDKINAVASGLNIDVTLPSYYNNLLLSYRIIKTTRVDEDNMSLISTM